MTLPMPEVKLHNTIESIGADLWNRLCGTEYPFLRYEFLHALEHSGSVGRGTGWQPLHLQIIEAGETLALIPLYLKTHSYGEYVFDWSWAEAYQRNGLEYYPKLVNAIPFTPASGPRFGSSIDDRDLIPLLNNALSQVSEKLRCSSWHCLFLPQPQSELLFQQGCHLRLGTQFHWFNRDYRSFDDFLQQMTSRRRKNLRKEREKIGRQDVILKTLQGAEISDEVLQHFYHCYQLTYAKRGQRGYLTESFFRQLRDTMPEQLIMVTAWHQQNMVAGALSLRSSDTLYGRYWGCLDEFDSLHFEACYYRGIDYCIAHGLQRFDPGAQGEHKVQRGFEPVETWSAHSIREAGFRDAIRDFCAEEAEHTRRYMAELSQNLPFRQPEE
ncbi:GNAT family N-acetyltransferase [Marinobacterium jannaschii]|uniref:GNAT family N-acetyltransferase n=1 Tax=Marinobacterium jannaschii TaxID=64970 RepID=UPI000A4932B8|nr:GNAT family N-acetyltransferase [Marinobacterium jannaschii]